MESFAKILSQELGKSEHHIQNVIDLLADGNTIPFIARYRKEVTGSLDDEVLRNLYERLVYLRNLEEKKQTVLLWILKRLRWKRCLNSTWLYTVAEYMPEW
mgnify:CR=1 FL=1